VTLPFAATFGFDLLTLQALLLMILLVGGLVLIHEGGHFLVARAFGVTVKVFSIGFGPRLFGIKRGKTDYRFSAIPIGGYVRWLGADPFSDSGSDDELDWVDAKGSFIHKPAWQRLLVVAAGPITNLILPIFVFTGLYMAGDPQPASEVGWVDPGSASARAGVVPGDRIVELDGEPMLTWLDVYESLDRHQGDHIALVVERDGQRIPVTLTGEDGGPLAVSKTGLGDSYADATALVDDPASPAGKSGILTGDLITKVDGQEVASWLDVQRALGAREGVSVEVLRRIVYEGDPPPDAPFTETRSLTLAADPGWLPERLPADDDTWARWGLASGTLGIGTIHASEDGVQMPVACSGLARGDRLLKLDNRDVRVWFDVERAVAATADEKPSTAGPTRPIDVVVRRDGKVLTLRVTPLVTRTVGGDGSYRFRPLIGFGPVGGFAMPESVLRPYPFLRAADIAVRETWGTAAFLVERVGEMVTGDAPVSQNLGGPVKVMNTMYDAAREGMFVAARRFAAMSLSLGVINLVPIPVLDGGQILTYAAEWIRGRPLPYRIRERLQQAGLLFIVGLMLLVTFWDVRPTPSVTEIVPKCE